MSGGRGWLAVGSAAAVLVAGAAWTATAAAASVCQESSAPAGYTVKVCLTSPASGASLSGEAPVAATVTVPTGTSPGVQKLVFTLDGSYLLTDYQTTYQFGLHTGDFADGAHSLGVSAVMRDGYQSAPTTLPLTFTNGNTTAPVNAGAWHVPTLPQALPARPFVVAAGGDGASGEKNATNVSNMIAGWAPDLFLYLGDVYEKGTLEEFRNWYDHYGSTNWFGRFKAFTAPTIGNHEYEPDPSGGESAPGYFGYWDNIPNYYSFDSNGWHFVALNSTSQYGQRAISSPQYQWLANDLAQNTSPCTIVYYHHPVWNIGPEGPTTTFQDYWRLLASNNVTLVLNGHDHNYQRWKAQDGEGALDPNGVVEVIAGGLGHGTQTLPSTTTANVAAKQAKLGAVKLKLYGDHLDLEYDSVSTSGTVSVEDSSSIGCKGVDRIAPTAPSALTATAATGTVSLTWPAATDNIAVTGYRVLRDGVQIATTTSPGYVDATVANATTYTYRVVALDAAGNLSGPSPDTSVTTGGVDVTPPSAPGGLTAQSAPTEVGLTWAASTDNVGVDHYVVLRDGVVLAATTSRQLVDTTAAAQLLHTYTVVAVDAAGNVSGSSNAAAAAIDAVAPSAPATVTAAAASPGSVLVSWSQAVDDVQVGGYRVFRDLELVAEVPAGQTTFEDMTVGSATTHLFEVQTVDLAGNVSTRQAASVTTLDTTSPDAPPSVSATAQTANSVLVSWLPAADNVAVTDYDVYRDSGAGPLFVGSTNQLQFTDTAALSDTTYVYSVRARDAAENTSVPATSLSVTTPSLTGLAISADSYVTADFPSTNYGTATTMKVDASPDIRSFVQFTVPAGSVQRVRLKIYATTAMSRGVVLRSTAAGWSETSLTYANAPAAGVTSVSVPASSVAGWFTVDITSLVSSPGTYSVMISNPSSTSASMATRLTTNAPKVLVDYAGEPS